MDTTQKDVCEHLLDNRTQILIRSALVGLSGLIPVPPLAEYLMTSLRRGLLQYVAQSRQVDLDEAALDVLVAPRASEPLVSVTSLAGLVAALRRGRWSRRLLGVVLLVRQLDEALRAFQQATLMDHYCARYHLGPGIDAARAQALRASIEEAGRRARREVTNETFARALHLAGRALSRFPWHLLGGSRREVEAEEPAPLVAASGDEEQRLVRDRGLHRFSRHLTAAFDQRWQQPPTESVRSG
ncbi:MAG: hypothetical protein RMK29_06670 [Myxococcales bacterium]|nr:hypothetical protein [Myxococcota bacterium]MDW8281377.1 hypothetical protein [Myxococcales bacterium]